MAFCTNCGEQLKDGAKFCAGCGTAIDGVGATASQRKMTYDGELHKCPNCGELLKSFVTNCPSCGYELRSVKVNSPVNELAQKVEEAVSVDEKIELITNFYVPNTKEDIFDFFILAVSNLEDTNYDTDDAWQAKLEQTYHKARISFGNSPEFEYIEKLYGKTCAKISKRGVSNFIRKNKSACIIALIILAGILMFTVGIILFAQMEDNFAAGWGGGMLALGGVYCFFYITEMKKKDNVAKKIRARNNNSNIQIVGKEVDDFVNEYYEDVVEYLRTQGFKNIVTKAEKKGLLDTEGAIKGISIAGNSDFSATDEFNINSTIIIRYYSKKC
ncbi:MAG: zinc ribbon domain-containing protein [Lachnospiraceae bacterium]|nr:zinc ribbon domain-containing protein [Lachnospiraceae bacterium]